jgi:ABC-type sugar transport system ATPase subunit
MNLLTGEVDAAGRLSLDEVAVTLPPALRSRCGDGEKLTLGIRPEAARLTLDGLAEADGVRLPGEVEMVEPDLARRRLIVFLRIGPHVYAVAADPDRWPKTGERLAAFFPADRLYFFDGVTGARIQ